MRGLAWIVVLMFLVVCGAPLCAHGQTPPASRARPAALSTYSIGPGDVLQVVVWKDDDLTRTVTVRIDGMITLPLLGDLQAGGQQPGQLAQAIAKALERYVEAPRVTVEVTQATSARFFVVGQVARSGEYPLSGITTVLHGLALAGGFKDFAKLDEIKVIRRDGTVVKVNYERIADGRDLRQNVVLGPGDTVVVP